MEYTLNLSVSQAKDRLERSLDGPIAEWVSLHHLRGWEPGLYGFVWADRFEIGRCDWWLSPHISWRRLFPLRLKGRFHEAGSGCTIKTSFPLPWQSWLTLLILLVPLIGTLAGEFEGSLPAQIATVLLCVAAIALGALSYCKARAENHRALEKVFAGALIQSPEIRRR